jgi:hypothetical protein
MLHSDKRSKSSGSNNWWTPKELFDELCKEYNFYPEVDVCADIDNTLLNLYITREQDALTRDWIIGKIKRKCWCNPPNADDKITVTITLKNGKKVKLKKNRKLLSGFIRKAYQQWKDLKIQTMMIVPVNVQGTKAWWDCIQDPMEGKDTGTSINAYCVVIFGRRNPYLKCN